MFSRFSVPSFYHILVIIACVTPQDDDLRILEGVKTVFNYFNTPENTELGILIAW